MIVPKIATILRANEDLHCLLSRTNHLSKYAGFYGACAKFFIYLGKRESNVNEPEHTEVKPLKSPGPKGQEKTFQLNIEPPK